mmetsp:Transcript_32690/g.83666  ORF Transcript_32690/g.83666 Transcript_32690/m.83666 type:complete len:174 (-) Transcript_32690:811-1332(-)
MTDAGVLSSSGVSTMDCGDPADFLWNEHPVVNKTILQANPLRDALSELDWWGGTLTLEMSCSTPTLRMSSKGDQGGCVFEFPPDCDPFDECACTEDTREDYRFSLIQSIQKALALSDKACLRVNRNGMPVSPSSASFHTVLSEVLLLLLVEGLVHRNHSLVLVGTFPSGGPPS